MRFAALIYSKRWGNLSLGHHVTCPRSWRLQVVQLELKFNCKASNTLTALEKDAHLSLHPHHAGKAGHIPRQDLWKCDSVSWRFYLGVQSINSCIRLACDSMVTLDLITQIAESPDPTLVNIYQVVSGFYSEIQPLFKSVFRVLLIHLFSVFPYHPRLEHKIVPSFEHHVNSFYTFLKMWASFKISTFYNKQSHLGCSNKKAVFSFCSSVVMETSNVVKMNRQNESLHQKLVSEQIMIVHLFQWYLCLRKSINHPIDVPSFDPSLRWKKDRWSGLLRIQAVKTMIKGSRVCNTLRYKEFHPCRWLASNWSKSSRTKTVFKTMK